MSRVDAPPVDQPPPALTANRRAFTVLVRNAEGRDGSLENITSGPVGKPLGGAKSGLRVAIVRDDRIVDYALRMPDQKRHAVEALRGLNYRVVAAGDSYNDTAMLGEANAGSGSATAALRSASER